MKELSNFELMELKRLTMWNIDYFQFMHFKHPQKNYSAKLEAEQQQLEAIRSEQNNRYHRN